LPFNGAKVDKSASTSSFRKKTTEVFPEPDVPNTQAYSQRPFKNNSATRDLDASLLHKIIL
jgi:hypothetical protein